MRTARTALPAALVVGLVVALAAAAALADRETAQFHAVRGEKALAAKKWDEAAGLYRKSIEEDDTYLPARYGLAQALVGSGSSAAAVDELRAFVDAARALSPLPPEWKPVLAKAEKQLTDLDAAGAALQKILDGYAADASALAERWIAKDPPFAERVLRRALKVKPGHAKSVALLEKMGKSAAGEVIDLFSGKDLSGWEWANPPTWQVVNGELVGEIRDAAVQIRSTRIFEGDFDVRIEARQIEEHPGPSMIAMLPAWKKETDCYQFGFLDRNVRWAEKGGSGEDREVVVLATEKLKTAFDAASWNVFEMRFRGKTVTALVNGEVVGEEPRPESRRGGFIGIQVQDIRAAFRKIQVEVR